MRGKGGLEVYDGKYGNRNNLDDYSFRPREGKGWSRRLDIPKKRSHNIRQSVSVPVRGKGGLEDLSPLVKRLLRRFFVSVPVRGKGGLEALVTGILGIVYDIISFRPREGKGWSRRNFSHNLVVEQKIGVSVPVRGKGGLEVRSSQQAKNHKVAVSVPVRGKGGLEVFWVLVTWNYSVFCFRPREGKGWSRSWGFITGNQLRNSVSVPVRGKGGLEASSQILRV